MEYRRDVHRDEPQEAVDAEVEHVREHLAMVADHDDDPATHRDDVVVKVLPHVDGDPTMVSIIGTLDADPDAPYLRDDFDPSADTEFEFRRYSEEGRE